MSLASDTSGEAARPVQLAPMHVPKASDVLAEELRERILRGEFPEGTSLPPERELVTQTQMSRTTVREALRILEVQGLVRVKTGRAGGAFVQKPGEAAIASSVTLLIRGRQIKLADLLETREAIEPSCARLAALHRTEADLARLDAANELIAKDGSLDDFLQANVDWHVGVALAGHNELLIGVMSALSRAIYTATNNQGFVDDDVRRATVTIHTGITKAIRTGDEAAAMRRMTRHVHQYAEAVLASDERTTIEVDD